jgi:hypothetical protein
MDLIRISNESLPKHGIISYHHGDPAKYRGRPPAFYEMTNGERVAGVILQRLSNEIDGGEVLARGFGKIYDYSYGKTLRDLYSAGVPLLARFLDSSGDKRLLVDTSKSKVYALPKNLTVSIFLVKLLIKKMNRVMYGLIFEKVWRIGTVEVPDLFEVNKIHCSQISEIKPRKPKGTRLADATAAHGGKIFCELISMKNYKGSIGVIENDSVSILPLAPGLHFSFPTLVNSKNENFLLTESAEHSSPVLFKLDSKMSGVIEACFLKGLENERLIDPSHLYVEGKHFIFGGGKESHQRLDLFWSNYIFGPYEKHPASPICLTPEGSRLAGPIQFLGDSIFRFGQDYSSSYGDGIFVFEVLKITESEYVEKRVGELRFSGVNGPHSVFVYPDRLLIDYYENRLNFFAGVKRICKKFELALKRNPHST